MSEEEGVVNDRCQLLTLSVWSAATFVNGMTILGGPRVKCLNEYPGGF
jgi:hypothetical protein